MKTFKQIYETVKRLKEYSPPGNSTSNKNATFETKQQRSHMSMLVKKIDKKLNSINDITVNGPKRWFFEKGNRIIFSWSTIDNSKGQVNIHLSAPPSTDDGNVSIEFVDPKTRKPPTTPSGKKIVQEIESIVSQGPWKNKSRSSRNR
jgi:hypothetical protein